MTVIYRVNMDELKRMAEDSSTFFKTKPSLKIFLESGGEVLKRRPLTLKYGNYIYVLTKEYIEVSIPDDVWEGVNTPNAYLTYRIGVLLGVLGLSSPTKMFKKQSHVKWEDGNLVRSRGTSTLTLFPSFELVTFPYLAAFVRYLYFRPRFFTVSTATTTLASVYGISATESREHLDRAFSMGYLLLEEVETYPKSAFPLLVVKVVSENEGMLSFTALRRELTKYGMSYRETFDLIFEALDKNWVDEVKGKYISTDIGREALKDLVPPKIRKLIVVSIGGREFIGM